MSDFGKKTMTICPHLTLQEVIKSNTALRLNIDNYPPEEYIQNIKILAGKVFQPLRDNFQTPIYISSGYRCLALNTAIGGSKSSQHCKGQAFDIDQDNKNAKVSNREVFYFIKNNLDFDQLIWEFGDSRNPDWVHVSYNTETPENNSKQVLAAYKENGKTKYRKYDA